MTALTAAAAAAALVLPPLGLAKSGLGASLGLLTTPGCLGLHLENQGTASAAAAAPLLPPAAVPDVEAWGGGEQMVPVLLLDVELRL